MDYREKLKAIYLEKRHHAENKIADLETKREYLYEEYVNKRQNQLRKWISFFDEKLAELNRR